jgi:recombinational DNA repair ATPase RecF
MRLIRLDIQNIRGIRDLSLEPKGHNFAVWGPNGSGKSAVVDAVDFLLTGRISRLTGKGTGGITLARHGSHVDHDPEEAIVRGVFRLPGEEESIVIQRCMARPNKLECDVSIMPRLAPILEVAQRGQHVLTRREILKYITAEPSTRAQEIQTLLDVNEIEKIRRSLVRVRNNFDKGLKSAKKAVATAEGGVNSTAQVKRFNRDAILEFVNQNRAVLDGDPIPSLDSERLKEGLNPPTVISDTPSVNVTLFERDIANTRDVLTERSQGEIAKKDEELRELLLTVRSDPELLRALERRKLLKLGLDLIDETGVCPLCGISWSPGELKAKLEAQLSTAEVAAQHQSRIRNVSSELAGPVNTALASIQKIVTTAQLIDGLQDEIALLESWITDLQKLGEALNAALEMYPIEGFSVERVQTLLSPAEITQVLAQVESSVRSKYPKATPEQNAWDTLTRLEENLKALESTIDSLERAQSSYHRADVLLSSFEMARDEVLGKLYDDVRDRFVELYRALHESDEQAFQARLAPEGAGLEFEVDFHGRGTHPPHALHSEGHQDSMGICLYLALAEELTEGVVDLIVLDDVMMSVDAGHRRKLCQLLATSFPDRQFLITTHDKTWANQLKYEGVVTSKRTVEFFNWSIDAGPQVNCEAGIWTRIEKDLERNDVPSAAARLRRGSEAFFATVCDSLGARVRYRTSGRWELGDFLPAAVSQHKDLLKKAKRVAQSWGNKDELEKLNELDSVRSQVLARSNVEQWAVNANVHYNAWADFLREDFRPVVEAFQDLYGLFRCNSCGGVLYVTSNGPRFASVRCNCGKVNWNLEAKT